MLRSLGIHPKLPPTIVGDSLELDVGGFGFFPGGLGPIRGAGAFLVGAQPLVGQRAGHGVRGWPVGVLLRVLHLGGDGQVQQGPGILQLLVTAGEGMLGLLGIGVYGVCKGFWHWDGGVW